MISSTMAGEKSVETATPIRNFTLTLRDRVRALTAGPPAYARRKRRIEDIEEAILRELTEARALAADRSRSLFKQIDELNRLIDSHNRYYPIESNLPMDPGTGAFLERGAPWRPIHRATLESFLMRLGK